MPRNFKFDNLFIFDLANNHQGDLEHGLKIIAETGKIVKKHNIRAAFKFQFRQFETFIHPDFKDKKDIKHIPRFLGTALTKDDYARMTDEVKKQGMLTMATPFDEESVDIIKELDIDLIKIASCSAYDWPLLKKAALAGKPIVLSTAGLSIHKIDTVVSFLQIKNINFAIMHCVAVYPTPEENLNLNQITLLKERFPEIPIGFSTHEDPARDDYITMAFAKGATLFERHVGLKTKKHELNTYSSTPEMLEKWISSYKKAAIVCGGEERSPALLEEKQSLKSLKRGVYAKGNIKKGSRINKKDVFFAMPLQDGQLASESWFSGIKADKDYKCNEPLNEFLAEHEQTDTEYIYSIMLQVKGMLNKGRVFIGENSAIEISHHYGLRRLREYGCIIIDCINREYCKKLIIQLPRQKHPYHCHEKKEESFQLLSGDLEVELNGHRTKLKPGDIILIPRGAWHKFHTLDGAVFEEISTTHYNDDSIYEDEKIAKLPREKRKTTIPNWEREIDKKIWKK